MSGDIVDRLRAEVVPCPGKGWDGNSVQHCAECCFGTGVDAATADELRVMVLARDAAAKIERLRAEVERLMDGMEWAWAIIANGQYWDATDAARQAEWEKAKFTWRDEHWHPALDRNKEARRG